MQQVFLEYPSFTHARSLTFNYIGISCFNWENNKAKQKIKTKQKIKQNEIIQ